MEGFDGRGLAIGIAVGVFVGLGLSFLSGGNALWVSIMAALGAVIGMNAGWFTNRRKDDGNGPDDSEIDVTDASEQKRSRRKP